MSDAVQLALAHNRSIQSATFDVKRADAEGKAAATRRLPSFSAFAEAGQSLVTPFLSVAPGLLGTSNGSPIPAKTVDLTAARTPSAFVFAQVLEPLTGQYQLSLEVKALKIGREITSESLRATEQEIASQVRRPYLQIVDDTSALKSTQADIRLYTELERVTKIYVAEKTALPSDLLDVQGHLLHAQFEETSASNALATDEEQLNALLGRPIETAMTVEENIEQHFILPAPAEAVERAMALRSDLKEADLQVEQADLNRRAKRAEYIPQVSLESSYVSLSGSSLPIGGNGYAEVGVQLQWEPFDWGRKHQELDAKATFASQARLKATDVEMQARIEVNAALRNAQAATALLRAEAVSAEAAEETLHVAQEKYEQRSVLLDEVLKLESAKQHAQQILLEARIKAETTYEDLRKAMGEAP